MHFGITEKPTTDCIQIFVVGSESRTFSATECVSAVQGNKKAVL